jgi:hypothetical protein
MQTQSDTELREAWEQAWRMLEGVLEDLGCDSPGDPWDEWALAQFIDVPGFAIGEHIPAVAATAWGRRFDLVGRLRKAVAEGLARIEGAGKCPLPLQWGLTGAILAWEWHRMLADGRRPWEFFEHLRELRLRMPEVSFCERTVHGFCERVPPPKID